MAERRRCGGRRRSVGAGAGGGGAEALGRPAVERRRAEALGRAAVERGRRCERIRQAEALRADKAGGGG